MADQHGPTFGMIAESELQLWCGILKLDFGKLDEMTLISENVRNNSRLSAVLHSQYSQPTMP